MGERKRACMTDSAVVRELYWGCGGGVMECFSGAMVATVPNRKPDPTCMSAAKLTMWDSPTNTHKTQRR